MFGTTRDFLDYFGLKRLEDLPPLADIKDGFPELSPQADLIDNLDAEAHGSVEIEADTAYVIFAVAVGMAVGAANLWVAIAGIPVVAAAAILMRNGADPVAADASRPFRLQVRLAIGQDAEAALGATLNEHAATRALAATTTARQGMALDLVYEVTLRAGVAPDGLVKALNRLEGVQDVGLERTGSREDGG
jgi:hypothetical protein